MLCLLDLTSDACLTKLYIMAFTSGLDDAGSDNGHSVQLRANGLTSTVNLYDLPGDDYESNKGDLWKMRISDFHFANCITIEDITGIAIVARSDDGWNIDLITTYVGDESGKFQELSQDFDVYRWIDGNGDITHRFFDLTIVHRSV